MQWPVGSLACSAEQPVVGMSRMSRTIDMARRAMPSRFADVFALWAGRVRR